MGGILWSTWRSVRGIEVTYRMLRYARWSHYGVGEMWDDHFRHGVADDGAPTGIEHAFRFESFQPDLVVLMSRWSDRTGARLLRELYHAAPDKDVLVPVLHDAALVRDQHPVRAQALDLDVLHELAHGSKHLGELAKRWRSRVRFLDIAMPRFFPTECHVSPHGKELTQQLTARRTACTGTEREMLDQIEADPKNAALLLVYADWLETIGRLDDAMVVRARL